MKNKVRHAHPNIYEIVDLLQTTQAMTEITVVQYSAGGARPPKRPVYRRIDSKLQQLKDRYRQGLMTVTDYADAASHLLHLD